MSNSLEDCTDFGLNMLITVLWHCSAPFYYSNPDNIDNNQYSNYSTYEELINSPVKKVGIYRGRVINVDFEPFFNESIRVDGKIMIDGSLYERDDYPGYFNEVISKIRSGRYGKYTQDVPE